MCPAQTAVQVAVLVRQAAVFAVRPARAVRSAADPAPLVAAWSVQFAALVATPAEWAQAGSDGRYRPAGGRSAAVLCAVSPPAARSAERFAASALPVARRQAAANAGSTAAREAEEVPLSVVVEAAVVVPPAAEEAAAVLPSAAEEAALLAAAAVQAALQPAASRPEVFRVRVSQVRGRALAPAQAGSGRARSQARRRILRRRPESYWSSAADAAISLSCPWGGFARRYRGPFFSRA